MKEGNRLEADMLEIRIDNEAKIMSDRMFEKIDFTMNEIEFDFEIEDDDLLDAIRSKLLKKIKIKMFSI